MPIENRPIPPDEGGLHAPAGIGFWRTVWWWFDFLFLVNLARFRFILILAAIGIVIAMWGTITAYYDKWTRPSVTQTAGDTEYFCPMHPTVVREHAKEKCPICYMPLSKRKKGETKEEALPPGIVNRVQLSPYRVVLAGIETTKVEHVPLHKEIVAVGSVEFNERELKHVAARVKARIDKLYVNETGQWVTKNQPLASLYSPDLIVTAQNLIDANRARNSALEDSTRDRLRLWGIADKEIDLLVGVQNLIDSVRKGDKNLRTLADQQLRKLDHGESIAKAMLDLLEGQRTDNPHATADARQRLVKLDLHEDQLDDILETGKAIRHLMIRAPIKGHVLKKFVKEGQYVDEGSPLYDVVDLNTVWIQAQVYEEDMAFLPTFHHPLKAGEESDKALSVSATTRASPTEVFKGRLAFVTPHVDPETRTVVARFELDNPGHKLRPGTSANVTFQIPPRRVAVIGDALARRWAEQTALLPSNASAMASLIHAAGEHALLHQGLVLAVPDTAVIDTGSQQIVYREIVPGEYEGVRVELGPRMSGQGDAVYFPVLSGLQAGDVVVKAGTFLVDAETRLNPAAGSIYFGGSGSKGAGSSTVRPSTPADEEAKIKASLDKLNDADRRLASAQVFCPILDGSRLGSMGVPTKVTLGGEAVLLCCKGCNAKALANPQQTLAAVKELKLKAAQK